MPETLKLPGQEPRWDLSGTIVHIAEYDRVTLQVVQRWPVQEYARKASATEARRIVVELLTTLFPDPEHRGSRPLTEQDLEGIRQSVTERLDTI